MPRLLVAHPIRPGLGDAHRAWCEEIRSRRDELGASRERVGILREIVWCHAPSNLAVLRIDGDDPLASLRRLEVSEDPFDRWFAARQHDVHGGPPLPAGAEPPEILTEYVDGEPDELEMFIAVAVPLLAGQTDRFRAAVDSAGASGEGGSRLRLWRMQQLAIWLQRSTSMGDVVIYDAVGDLPEMLRSLAESDDELVASQRAAIREWFGIDLTAEPWPLPVPARSWSAANAPF